MMDHKLEHIGLRVTAEEKALILEKAEQAGMTISDYVRSCALRRQILSHLDREVLLELARLRAESGRVGGLMRWWLTDAVDMRTGRRHARGPAPKDKVRDIQEVLQACTSAQDAIAQAAEMLSKRLRFHLHAKED